MKGLVSKIEIKHRGKTYSLPTYAVQPKILLNHEPVILTGALHTQYTITKRGEELSKVTLITVETDTDNDGDQH